MNNPKILTIGIGSTARSGKSSLAQCLLSLLKDDGYYCGEYPLAHALKKQCEDFLWHSFKYNVWTENTEEKSKFRDFLVIYGKMAREMSEGKFWTSIVEDQIIKDAEKLNKSYKLPYVAIVPDIRYNDPKYKNDEVHWVQKRMNGILIDLNRIDEGGVLIPPANKDEEINSSSIKEVSDYHLTWNTIRGEMNFTDLYNGEIFNQVKPLYEQIKREYLLN